MKSLRFLSWVLMFSCTVTVAQSDLPDRQKKFETAYAEYQRLSREGKWAESLPYAQQAYEIGKSVMGEKDQGTAILAFNYGKNLDDLRDYAGAARLYEESLAIDEAVLGKDSPKLINTLIKLGHVLDKAARNKEADVLYDRALLLTEQQAGPQSLEYAKLVLDISDSLIGLKQYGAKKYLQASYDILKKEKGEQDPLTGLAAFQLGKFYLGASKEIQARDFLLQTLNTFNDPDRPDNRMEMITHGFLVETFERLGESEEATRHCLAIGRMTPVAPTQDYYPVYKAMPEYPGFAASKGIEGYVIVEFTVTSYGFVKNPVVITTSNETFNKASLEAVKKFRYAPKFIDGKPIDVAGVQNKIIFQMKK
jgi:TonB family protein